MLRGSLSIILGLLLPQAFSQNWSSAGLLPSFGSGNVKTVVNDTVSNKILIGGTIFMPGNSSVNSICIFDGINWTCKDSFNNQITSLCFFNNELYAGGSFTTVNSTYAPYIAKWNGTSWINIGDTVDASVINMKVINNELYVMGQFTRIGGKNINGIAKWNGSTWMDVNNFPSWSSMGWYISDCAIFNGDMYVGGHFATSTGLTAMAVYKNNSWQSVHGLNDSIAWAGGFTSIDNLVVYQNALYAGGLIVEWKGNVGNGIQKWDGNSWSTVGTGVQDPSNTNLSGFMKVNRLKHYKGLLYASGNFSFAGNVPSPAFSVWNGSKWCGIDRNFDQSIQDFCFCKDTLYIGTADSIEHVYVNWFGKFLRGDYTYTDTCSINFNSIRNNFNSNSIFIYPDPATATIFINVTGIPYRDASIMIRNALGQEVMKTDLLDAIDVSDLPPGYYFIELILPDKQCFKAKFIKG